ncbi:hypothetical protein K505DRAFT_415194 [Melanomma pulvis-pyrius CBS 109.77]|uniref:BTB domain-containing protein n=1 Tax=Melanomma pulvis-pyrius CBS 109.77 TaxID=1314802 RepID=A0A6A6XNU3_9PLEO|nr:hypothetical protein K505DRAFT_415194 [Melanomma pulvis-pyrius CBS 109.77]
MFRRNGRVPGTRSSRVVASDVIIVRVGEGTQREDFSVHESIVRPRSEFFANALPNAPIEGTSKVIKLPDQTPKIFRRYLDYLYTTMLPAGTIEVSDQFVQLSNLYVLCEKLVDVGLKDVILRKMVTLAQERYMVLNSLAETVDIIYNGTPSYSNARCLLLDIFVDSGTHTWLPADWDPPKQFLRDLATGLLMKRPFPTDSSDSLFTCDPSRYMEKEE